MPPRTPAPMTFSVSIENFHRCTSSPVQGSLPQAFCIYFVPASLAQLSIFPGRCSRFTCQYHYEIAPLTSATSWIGVHLCPLGVAYQLQSIMFNRGAVLRGARLIGRRPSIQHRSTLLDSGAAVNVTATTSPWRLLQDGGGPAWCSGTRGGVQLFSSVAAKETPGGAGDEHERFPSLLITADAITAQ